MKNLLKQFLLPTLTSRPISNIGTTLFGQGVPIFMLHRMQSDENYHSGTTEKHLRRCLRYLVDNGYQFISLEQIINNINAQVPLPKNAVAFTMDDGHWDQAEITAPIFIEFNCPLTIFIITEFLDKKNWPWDDKVAYLINETKTNIINIILDEENFHLPVTTNEEKSKARSSIRKIIKNMAADSIDQCLELLSNATECDLPHSPPDYFRPMEWEQARLLEKKGVKFAPHTISHRILSKIDAAIAESEIFGSWQRIQDELTSPSPVFAYPTGRFMDYGPREINILKQAGFLGAVSTIPETIDRKNTNPNYVFNLPRLSLPNDFNDFVKYCSWVEKAEIKLSM